MKKLIALTLILTIAFSCKKEDKYSCPVNVTSISGTYKMAAYTYKESSGSPEVDLYPIMFPDECDRDNVLIFNTDGTYQIKDVGIVCSTVGGESAEWSLYKNKIDMDGIVLNIESFDCSKLVLTVSNFMESGDKLRITLIK